MNQFYFYMKESAEFVVELTHWQMVFI